MIFHPFFAVHVDNLSPGDPLKALGNDLGDLFTFMVEMLKDRDRFPSPPINDLLTLTWWLVNQKKVRVGTAPGLPLPATMHFASDKDCKVGFFSIPADWAEQVKKRRAFCAGGLVWAASHCRDFYNGRMSVIDKTVIPRAVGYEAEYYLTLQKSGRIETNEYQKQVLYDCPKGLASIPNLLYKRKDFMGKAS
jgi:hypothetical protein